MHDQSDTRIPRKGVSKPLLVDCQHVAVVGHELGCQLATNEEGDSNSADHQVLSTVICSQLVDMLQLISSTCLKRQLICVSRLPSTTLHYTTTLLGLIMLQAGTSWMRTSPLQVLITRSCEPSLHEPNYALHLEVADYINNKKANKCVIYLCV